jgi:6-phosphofructokinase 1
MKIAILTSGGDSAGMNAVVRAVVKAGILKGCETWVVREGYEGLVRGNKEYNKLHGAPSFRAATSTERPDPSSNILKNLRFGDGPLLKEGTGDDATGRTLKGRYIIRVGWDDVRGWFAEGGTLTGTARSTTFRTEEGRLAAAENLIYEGIDALVVCGGDGSLTGADVFRSEWPQLINKLYQSGQIDESTLKRHSHLRIVGLVGSIDNDMSLTDMTIGAPTALHRICEAIDNINTTALSHSRAFVIEVMGRHCGWLALFAAISGGADFLFIPEKPADAKNWQDEMCNAINHHRELGKRKTLVIIAEGAHDSNLNSISANDVKEILSGRMNLDTRVTTLGHTQRGGRPCALDRITPTLQGFEAVNALLAATPDTPSYMIGICENKITRVPLMEAVATTRAVAEAIGEKEFEKAMSLRDPEFKESLSGFSALSEVVTDKKLPEQLRMRVAIMHVGAPAGGMNAATRAAARYCIRHGHTPIGVHNGFRGLADDDIHILTWLGVDSWGARGGSELGTNRDSPSDDLGSVAAKFQQHSFDGLMLIGGFDAFDALLSLKNGRKIYPAFNIPMVHLPATISNNVPMTEYSLGSDTCLNALVDACDAIKQSASASRNRVFVVETQGGKCGYIATMGALAAGACLVYTPEHGINLDTLREDAEFLKKRYSLDAKGKSEGRLVIRNDRSSNIYTTDFITSMLKEEGGSLFDSRSANLGHTLQGGIPSPTDRARAVRLSLKCMAFLEKHFQAMLTANGKTRHAGDDSAAVITIQGSHVKWVPVDEMVKHADMKNRRGSSSWWTEIKELVELLVAKPQISAMCEERVKDSQ